MKKLALVIFCLILCACCCKGANDFSPVSTAAAQTPSSRLEGTKVSLDGSPQTVSFSREVWCYYDAKAGKTVDPSADSEKHTINLHYHLWTVDLNARTVKSLGHSCCNDILDQEDFVLGDVVLYSFKNPFVTVNDIPADVEWLMIRLWDTIDVVYPKPNEAKSACIQLDAVENPVMVKDCSGNPGYSFLINRSGQMLQVPNWVSCDKQGECK